MPVELLGKEAGENAPLARRLRGEKRKQLLAEEIDNVTWW